MTELREKDLGPPARELRLLRENAGLTKLDLAAALNTALPAVYQWEKGDAWPTIDKLPRMAELLGVSVAELVASLIQTRRAAS